MELEIKTSNEDYAGTNDYVTIDICDNQCNCCYIVNMNDEDAWDDMEQGAIQKLRCQYFMDFRPTLGRGGGIMWQVFLND